MTDIAITTGRGMTQTVKCASSVKSAKGLPMSDLAREMVEDPDNKLWDAPDREFDTTCYFKQNSIEISIPSSPTAWIEADAAYNLEDMR